LEVVFIHQIREGGALENVEIDFAVSFSDVLRSIDEPFNFVLPNIKDDTIAIFLNADASQAFSVLWRYGTAEVRPCLL
jgi:hypothetical protein